MAFGHLQVHIYYMCTRSSTGSVVFGTLATGIWTVFSILVTKNLLGHAGLDKGCKAPKSGLIYNVFRVRPSPTAHGLDAFGPPTPGLELASAPLALVKLH